MNLDESPVELTVRVVLVEVVTVMGEGSGIISTSSSCMVDVVVPSAPNSFFYLIANPFPSIFIPRISSCINSAHRIVSAVSKHIVPDNALPCGSVSVSV